MISKQVCVPDFSLPSILKCLLALSPQNTDGWEGYIILCCSVQSMPIFAFLSISTLPTPFLNRFDFPFPL